MLHVSNESSHDRENETVSIAVRDASAFIVPCSRSLAGSNDLARTLLMSWNSWNKSGCNINQILIEEIADALDINEYEVPGHQP